MLTIIAFLGGFSTASRHLAKGIEPVVTHQPSSHPRITESAKSVEASETTLKRHNPLVSPEFPSPTPQPPESLIKPDHGFSPQEFEEIVRIHKCVDLTLLGEAGANYWEKRALKDHRVRKIQKSSNWQEYYHKIRDVWYNNYKPSMIEGQEAFSYVYDKRKMNVFYVKGHKPSCKDYLYVYHSGYSPGLPLSNLYRNGDLTRSSFSCDTVLIDHDSCWFVSHPDDEFLVGNSKRAWETFEKNKPDLARARKLIIFGPSLGSLLTAHFSRWFLETRGADQIHQVAVSGVWERLKDFFIFEDRWYGGVLEYSDDVPDDALTLVDPLKTLISAGIDVRVHLIQGDTNLYDEDQLRLAAKFTTSLDMIGESIGQVPETGGRKRVLQIFLGDEKLKVYLHLDERVHTVRKHSAISTFIVTLAKARNTFNDYGNFIKAGELDHERDLILKEFDQ